MVFNYFNSLHNEAFDDGGGIAGHFGDCSGNARLYIRYSVISNGSLTRNGVDNSGGGMSIEIKKSGNRQSTKFKLILQSFFTIMVRMLVRLL